MKSDIVLASASKRRSLILASCGIRHKVYVTNVQEIHNQRHSAQWNVICNAKRKALACVKKYKRSVIIGADTLVVLNRRLIGKPQNKKEAKALLQEFSGKRLEVVTGLFLLDSSTGKSAAGSEKSLLYAEKLSPGNIDRWFNALRPYDKAGGFSIEGVGSLIYDRIRGSYFNILGLPMIKLKKLFTEVNLSILDYCD
jgi:septum formation protein